MSDTEAKPDTDRVGEVEPSYYTAADSAARRCIDCNRPCAGGAGVKIDPSDGGNAVWTCDACWSDGGVGWD